MAGMGAVAYVLMRKDFPITYMELTPDGGVARISTQISNREMAPLEGMYRPDWLARWWGERSIPMEQDNVKRLLDSKGYPNPGSYLTSNLGLSLTDYYWLRPVGSGLSWKDVNLFDNDFKDDLLDWRRDVTDDGEPTRSTPRYTPNGSLQGTIEKTWVINNGERCLVKGNHSYLSAESINEVIASEIHRRQGFAEYADYHLVRIAGKDYEYGCYSKLFTSQERELVSAWALYSNEKRRGNVSTMEHLLNMCTKYGMDKEEIRAGLEYQMLVDFVMSGHDRHLTNISFLRDADTLRFTGLSPIYDSGGSMFAGKEIPRNMKGLLSVETGGIVGKESNVVKLVRDKGLIDLAKLPPASYVCEMYSKDPKMSEKDINNIAHWYEVKIDLCRDLQLGRDVFSKTYVACGRGPVREPGIQGVSNGYQERWNEFARGIRADLETLSSLESRLAGDMLNTQLASGRKSVRHDVRKAVARFAIQERALGTPRERIASSIGEAGMDQGLARSCIRRLDLVYDNGIESYKEFKELKGRVTESTRDDL